MFHRILRGRLTFKFYLFLCVGALVTFWAYYYVENLRVFSFSSVLLSSPQSLQPRSSRHLSKLVTVLFRQFDEFENDIADSVQSFVSAFPNMPIVVVGDKQPYPPFLFSMANKTLRNVKVMSLELRLDASPQDLNPLTYVTTEFVLLVPDATRVVRRVLQHAMNIALKLKNPVAIGVGHSHLICQQVKWNYQDWTLQYSRASPGKPCDSVHGHHALLVQTETLKSLPDPFSLPFPEAFYLQTHVRGVKINLVESKLDLGRVLNTLPAKQKTSKQLREQRIALYKQIGVKATVREDGRVQWFGCKKETPRCFPSTLGTPSYILSGRNTPPCCRRNLRRTAAHVLAALAQAGARCWLETTALLGAVVRSDLLPWSEYVEVGVHAADITRVSQLQRAGTDNDGYVWERATKGHYYRVAYSSVNRLYVLILPFEARNGTMRPADWVLAHQREFPERHLHPLAQIHFAGKQAPAPNDARAFLDHKLGPGAVERCEKLGPKLLYP